MSQNRNVVYQRHTQVPSSSRIRNNVTGSFSSRVASHQLKFVYGALAVEKYLTIDGNKLECFLLLKGLFCNVLRYAQPPRDALLLNLMSRVKSVMWAKKIS